MKKLLFTLLLGGVAMSASAQMRDRVAGVPTDNVTKAGAEQLTRQMTNRLRLNEAQYIRLRTVNQLKLARMDEIQWQYRNDPKTQQARLIELEAQYEQECRRILTPSQISLLRDEQPHDVVPTPTETAGNGLG
ncbi:hypothetical protein [Hymenobacter sp. CRA2]|uniref:hypothetical protein n=1 Tax=Hymenobacter sp. CRA2 TaxID=1955620 RepID=UPI00098FCA97|nr:hypothetical protein [Hymenobacter sp. CRA2]OON69980.1 hypothetical protein B0919_04325 [Hymenobacter sp. CRA2]